MSRYQKKIKPICILLWQETVSGSGISWAICKSAPCSRQITTPALHHSVFLQAGCPSCRPTNSVKALKAMLDYDNASTANRIILRAGFTQLFRRTIQSEVTNRPCRLAGLNTPRIAALSPIPLPKKEHRIAHSGYGTTPRSGAISSLSICLCLCLWPSPASGTLTSHALLAQTSLERMTSVGCRHPQRIYVFTRIFGRCKPIYICHSDPTNSQAILQMPPTTYYTPSVVCLYAGQFWSQSRVLQQVPAVASVSAVSLINLIDPRDKIVL